MPVNIRDLAERLNLSITTVSRALDGYHDVSPETRRRVIEAAQEMGYSPSRAARQLRKQQAEAVGFILPAPMPRVGEPTSLEFIAGLGDQAAANNYDLLLSSAPPDSDEEKLLYRRLVQGRRVDGIVLSRVRLHDWRVDYLLQAGFPFVAAEHGEPGATFPYIEVDSKAGMRMLVDHLARQGHRRIAFIGGPAYLIIQMDRLAGYLDGIVAAGAIHDERYIVTGDLSAAGGYRAAQTLLDLAVPPTAIMAINDRTAVGVVRAIHDRKLVPGKDLAVTGFDGLGDSDFKEPELTTIDYPVYQIASRLVMMLLKLIQHEAVDEAQVVLQPELLVRDSSGVEQSHG
jgi:LacI family transcriptional regulator